MESSEEIKEEAQRDNEQTAVCGVHPCTYQQRNTKLPTLIIPSNSCPKRSLPFHERALCVDHLQARPGVVGGKVVMANMLLLSSIVRLYEVYSISEL